MIADRDLMVVPMPAMADASQVYSGVARMAGVLWCTKVSARPDRRADTVVVVVHDRAYRIGQDRPVQVHRLITEGTLEDRIAALIEKKRELADAVISSGEGWIAELSDQQLGDLVSLRSIR